MATKSKHTEEQTVLKELLSTFYSEGKLQQLATKNETSMLPMEDILYADEHLSLVLCRLPEYYQSGVNC